MLNIPPNRDGKFSEQDVNVLKEEFNNLARAIEILLGILNDEEKLKNVQELYAEYDKITIDISNIIKC